MYPGRCPGLQLSLRFQRDETVALHFFSGAAFCKASNCQIVWGIDIAGINPQSGIELLYHLGNFDPFVPEQLPLTA